MKEYSWLFILALTLAFSRYKQYLSCPFSYLSCSHTEVFNKPGVCVKVLSLEPNSCQLQEDMAQLADCALPTELRVRTQ